MCFTISEKCPKALIAEKDIVAWKVLTADNNAPHYYFKYEKGFHYYQTGKLRRTSFNEINVGLHSYKTRAIARNKQRYGRKVVKMYIPKGAKYYFNDKEYVSTELVWYLN